MAGTMKSARERAYALADASGLSPSQDVANPLFEAQYALSRAEDAAFNALCRAFGCDPEEHTTWHFEDFAYDAYDSNYEALEADPAWTPTPEQVRATFALGFNCCWINYRDGTEAHYSKFDTRPEAQWGRRQAKGGRGRGLGT